MEGSYSRVWQLCRPSPSSSSALPRPEFAYFVATLVGTVRNEIAACDEKAYATLPLADAKTLLFFETEEEVRGFAAKVSLRCLFPFSFPLRERERERVLMLDTHPAQRKWFVDPQSIVHFPSSPAHPSKTVNTTGVPVGFGSFVEGDKELDKAKVVVATLSYAKELESIV